jgi:HK97 family phage portal protein
MSLLDRIINPTSTRNLTVGNVLNRSPLLGAPSDAGVNVTPDSGLRYSDVYACVRVLSDTAAGLPLHVHRRDENNTRTRVVDTLTARMLERPAPTMTQATLVSAIVANLNLWGNAFIAKFRNDDGRGPVQQLGLINPARVTLTVEAGEPIFDVEPSSTNGGAAGRYTRREILHIKALTTDGIIGLSPLTQAAQAIGVGVALQEYAARFFAQSAHPSGVLEHPSRLTPEAAERLSRDWQAKFGGTQNSSRVAVLEDGLQWRGISVPMHDAQFLEQRRYSATEIARVFRVPPYMIGADSGSSMTYSNVEQETQSFLQHSLQPWLVAIEQAFQADDDLFPQGTGDYPEFLMDALLRADSATRANIYKTATGGQSWMSANEVRERENLPTLPTEDTDVGDLATKSLIVQRLVSAGYDPVQVLAALGMPNISHTGLPPVLLQGAAQIAPDDPLSAYPVDANG